MMNHKEFACYDAKVYTTLKRVQNLILDIPTLTYSSFYAKKCNQLEYMTMNHILDDFKSIKIPAQEGNLWSCDKIKH